MFLLNRSVQFIFHTFSMAITLRRKKYGALSLFYNQFTPMVIL